MNLHEWIMRRVESVERLAHEAVSGVWAAVEGASGTAETALRRCEADRRVLARHRLPEPDDWLYPGCEGCGTTGEFDDRVADNINDCRELLDLAHAHGITADELAALDRPVARRSEGGPVIGHARISVAPQMTAEQAPATFRRGQA